MTAECLRSLLAMEGAEFSISVIDNGSSDASVEYLSGQFPGIRVLANGKNVGFAAGCNIGMRLALAEGAEFVLLVNNDTIVDRRLLAELLDVTAGKADVAVASPKIFYFEPADRLWWAGGTYSLWRGIPSHIGFRQKEGPQHQACCDIDWATGCVMLLRCEALAQTGLFDERMFGNGEDLDLSLRLRQSGWRIRYAPRALVWHKEGADYRRNVGEHIRKFTAVRNSLWIMHKHGTALQWITFIPQYLVYLFHMVAASLRHRDGRSAKAILGGVAAYFEMRRDPKAVALPPDLIRTMLPSAMEQVCKAVSSSAPSSASGN